MANMIVVTCLGSMETIRNLGILRDIINRPEEVVPDGGQLICDVYLTS